MAKMGQGEEISSRVGVLSPDREAVFPNLRNEGYRVTSDEEDDYNCIAWAAERKDARWWPVEGIDGVFWPYGVPLEETVDAFILAFGTEGYVPCDDGVHETGYEKIAIYANDQGEPCHAARQIETGHWTSKLGFWEDIEHFTLSGVTCEDYGRPVKFLKRPLRSGSNSCPD
jgi:hypothetical protein